MMTPLKSFVVRLLPFMTLGVVLAVPDVAHAAASGTSDGTLSVQLATDLYCSAKDLLQGSVGLLLGLILVFMGIWAMVQGAKIMAAIPLIVIGAIITALPSLVEASFGGLDNLLTSSGISDGGTYDPPSDDACRSTANGGSNQSTPNTVNSDDPYVVGTPAYLQTQCPPGAGSSACQ